MASSWELNTSYLILILVSRVKASSTDWGDTFVVPSSSRNQATAEKFIDYILRPEISAEIVNQKYYASTNEAAQPFVQPEILKNQAIYPTDAMLMKADIIQALSPEGQKLYDTIWQQFLDAYPKPQ